MDFEEQWKEEFLRNYLDSMKEDKTKGKTYRAPLNILKVIKEKLWN